jgi:hypothetical protein
LKGQRRDKTITAGVEMNHVDRFYAAVTVLAGDGHIKQRLMEAYTRHITGIHGSELPASLQEKFGELRQKMHSVAPLNGEGAICASVRKMSGPDAAECAVILVDLYTGLIRLGVKGKRRPPEEPAQVVPAFLVKSASA